MITVKNEESQSEKSKVIIISKIHPDVQKVIFISLFANCLIFCSGRIKANS